MNKKIIAVCIFFIVFFITSNVLAEVVAEYVEGGDDIEKITKIYDKDGNSTGTFEHIRVGSSTFNIRICDEDGVEVKRSGPTGASCGVIEPMYDEQGYIEEYRHFGVRGIGSSSSQFRTLYFDLDLVPTALINMWPDEEDEACNAIHFAYSMYHFYDEDNPENDSYMTVGYSSKGIRVTVFNSNNDEFKNDIFIDPANYMGSGVSSIGKVRATELENEIAIVAEVVCDGTHNLFIFKVDKNGKLVRDEADDVVFLVYNHMYGYNDHLGGVVSYQGDIIIIAQANGAVDNALYYLRINQSLVATKILHYTGFDSLNSEYNEEEIYVGDIFGNIELVPRCASINPDTGVIYIGGGVQSYYDDYSYIYSMIAMLDSDGYLVNEGIIIKNFFESNNNSLGAVIWTKERAIFGGTSNQEAIKVVYTATLKTYYQDLDGDKYGNPDVMISAYSAPEGYVVDNTDCNDDPVYGALCYPGNPDGDICGDRIDNDCINGIDDGCYYWRHLKRWWRHRLPPWHRPPPR